MADVHATAMAPDLPKEVLEALPTPCLLVDVAACERNISRAAEFFADTRTKLRPHFKAHKCSELLARQVDAGGCVGVTCATAAEAETLAGRGFTDILVANQVVDAPGLTALTRAAAKAKLSVAVDHPWHVELLARQAARAGVHLGVLIEIDVGMDRCGLEPGSEQLVSLAGAVGEHATLSFEGLQGYEGHAVLRATREERREHVERAAALLAAERERLLAAGLRCPIVSGGGTGTFDLAVDAGVLDEVQAGSYVLMDARYATLDLPFENALFLATTLVSHRRAAAATLNAGLKALSVEYGMPRALHSGLEVLKLADEHAWISVDDKTEPRIGETVFLIPAHIDPAINLHDTLFAWDARSGELITWSVDGRRHEAQEALR